MNALERSFADLCAKHDLSALQVAFHDGHSEMFSSFAHGEPGQCGMGHGATITEAIGKAIAELNAKIPITLADEPLTEAA